MHYLLTWSKVFKFTLKYTIISLLRVSYKFNALTLPSYSPLTVYVRAQTHTHTRTRVCKHAVVHTLTTTNVHVKQFMSKCIILRILAVV